MSYGDPFGQKPEKSKPKIWAEGGQRPPFDLRALGRASLHLSREAVAPILAWKARTMRRVAVNVKNGVGRIPSDKLAGAARFLPSHLRVAGWIKNLAATLSHASASADPDIKRGNALVAEIAPHLWTAEELSPPPPPPPPDPEPASTDPVVLAEPPLEYDPLASIREKLANQPPLDTAAAAAQGLIQYIAFPDALRGKYQCYTQADLTALRATGCDHFFADVRTGVAKYMASLTTV